MRDTSEGMIEIIEAFKEGEGYFSIIEVPKEDRKEKFRFGVTQNGYKAIRKILQSRLLDTMPGLKYQHFWDGSMSRETESKKIQLRIRCEVEGNGKTFYFEVPQDLASNLRWFNELKSLDEAKHLKLER